MSTVFIILTAESHYLPVYLCISLVNAVYLSDELLGLSMGRQTGDRFQVFADLQRCLAAGDLHSGLIHQIRDGRIDPIADRYVRM